MAKLLLDSFPTLSLRFPGTKKWQIIRSRTQKLVPEYRILDKRLTYPASSLFIARKWDSPIGCIEIQAGRRGLISVNLAGRMPLASDWENVAFPASNPAGQALAQIMEYLAGSRYGFDLEIDWSSMRPFQTEVLKRTLKIPFGEFLTYGQIAVELGNPAASRAVGGALAHNPIPIIIPCHRVVAANGKLTWFSAAEGIVAKQWLLELEGHTIVGEKLA